jgi:hypothetical protein
MNKEELIAMILSSSYDPQMEDKDEGDVVPIWWVKHVFNEAFPPKTKDDDKFYKSSCTDNGSVDMGDVNEY